MSKSKIFTGNLIGILGVIVLLLTFQFVNIDRAKAYGDAMYGHNQESLNFDNNINWQQNTGGKEYVFDLFTDAVDGSEANVKYFDIAAISDTWHLNWGLENSSKYYAGEKHYQYKKSGASGASPRNGYLQSAFTISDSLLQAGRNGYLSISATASFGSGSYPYKVVITYKDSPDNVTMTFSNSDGGMQSYTAEKLDGYVTQTFAFENATSATYYLKFNVDWKDGNCTAMNVKEPTITLKTTDTTAPVISGIDVNSPTTWTKSKTLSFDVTDSEAGIDRVEITDSAGEVVTPIITKGDATKTANVSFMSTKNNETYTITAFDNVGNSTTTTYTTSYIDSIAPNVEITSSGIAFKYLDVDGVKTPYAFFNATLNTPDLNENGTGASAENYYFTVNGDSERRFTLVEGENSFPLTQAEFDADNKDFVVNIFASDEAGNTQNFDYNLSIEYFKYSINKIGRGGAVVFESVADVVSPQSISYSFEQSISNDSNFEFYRVLINGNDATSLLTGDSETGYTLSVMLDENKNIEVVYREVAVVYIKEKYDYTGSNITLEVLSSTNCPLESVIFDEVNLVDLGDYTINYTVNTDEFVGAGSVNVSIVNKVNFEYNSSDFTFSEDGLNFACTIDEGVNYTVEILDSNGASIKTFDSVTELNGVKLDAGNYTFKLEILDENTVFIKNDSSAFVCDFVVEKIEVTLPYFDKTVTYSASKFDFGATYQDYNVSVIYTNSEGAEVSPQNAGEYNLTISIVDKNYSGTMTGKLTILPANLVVTALNKTTVYGESLLNLDYTVSGFVGSDTAEFTPICAEIEDLNGARLGVGEYDIAITQRADLTNYQISYVNACYTVTARPVQIEIAAGQTKSFGAVEPEIEYSVTGVLSGDILGEVIARAEGENVGNYEISLKSWSNQNYTVTCYSANFRITANKIVIRAPSVSYVYGSAIPDSFTPIIVSGGVSSGADLGVKLVCVNSGNVGRYQITMEKVADTLNYEIVYIAGYVTITKKSVIVKANEISKVYGENDGVLSYTVFDANGEEILVSADAFTGSLAREIGENVGEYEIKKGTLKSKNYSITFEPAKFTITPKNLIIKAVNAGKTYGDADSSLKFRAFSGENEIVVNKNDFSGELARGAGENVGEYAITQGTLASQNYSLEFDLENAKFTIYPRLVYVVFGDYSVNYGEAEPEYAYRLSGVLSGDDLGLVVTRENSEKSDVGEYEITATHLNSNYILEVISGTLFIEKADSKITASDAEFIYNGEEFTPIALLSVDDEYSYSIVNELGAPVESVKNAGKYTVTFTFDGNQNFNGSTAVANYTVKKADASVEILKNIFVENGSIQMPEIKAELDYIIKFESTSTAAMVGEHAYSIVFADENYNSINSVLTILAKPSNSTDGGNVEFIDGEVDSDDVDLSIKKTDDNKTAQSATDMKVDSTYEIKYNQSGNATIKVELDYVTDDYTNVSVYVYNDKGEAKLLPYKVVDGKIVLSVDADNMKLAIVKKVTGISIVTIGLLVIIAGLVALNMVRRHKKKKTKNILKVC